jgi:hypothetical protein
VAVVSLEVDMGAADIVVVSPEDRPEGAVARVSPVGAIIRPRVVIPAAATIPADIA